MDFDNLLKKAMGLLRAKKKRASVVQVEKKGQEIENLVEKCNYKTRISFTTNCLIMPSSIPTYPPLNFSTTSLAQINGTNYQLVDKKINHFIEMMKGLAFLVRTLQNNTGLLATKNI